MNPKKSSWFPVGLLMSFSKFSQVFTLFLGLNTVSCGYTPLYEMISDLNKIEGTIELEKIEGKNGFYLREELLRRFGDPEADAHILKAKVKVTKSDEVITLSNEITSYKLTMFATFSLETMDGITLIPVKTISATTVYSAATTTTGYASQVAEDAANKRLSTEIGKNIGAELLILSKDWMS